MLDDIALYWLTNSAACSARIYWDNNNASLTSAAVVKTAEIRRLTGSRTLVTSSMTEFSL
jgi:hypothetical protein